MVPSTKFLKETPIKLNNYGYIPTTDSMETNVKGVYASGDARQKQYRQITTAVGEGTIIALEVIRNF